MYLIRDTEVVRILFVKAKYNDKSGNKNEDNFDTFTEESREFGNCNTVLWKLKTMQVFSGLSPGGVKGWWCKNKKRKVEKKR